jgi:hypothetical protein
LHGILYLHRIADNRVSGSAARNMRFYQELCGPETLKNSGIVLNMWNLIPPALAAAREEELKSKPNFLKPAVDNGARVFRHDGTIDSAHAILRELVKNTPLPLYIQRELVDEHKHVCQTVAGGILLQELAVLQQKHLQEMKELEQEMADALKQQDEEAQRELEEERKRIQLEQAKLEVEKQKLLQLRTTAAMRQEQERQAQQSTSGATATAEPSREEDGEPRQKKRHLLNFVAPILRRKSRSALKTRSRTKTGSLLRRAKSDAQ